MTNRLLLCKMDTSFKAITEMSQTSAASQNLRLDHIFLDIYICIMKLIIIAL